MSEKQKRAACELARLLEEMALESNQKLLGIAFAEGLSVGAKIGKEPSEDGGEKSA